MPETTAIRPGEELDRNRLAAYLGGQLEKSSGEIEIEQFPAGSSNLTYLIRVGGEEYVLRRPPFGNTVKTAHDMSREFNVLARLSAVYPPAPKPLLFCGDETVIGAEFYLMERRRGLILRGKAPDELVSLPTLQREACKSFVGNLAHLHGLDYAAAGLADLGRPEGYAHRQVAGWTKRYHAAKTHEVTDIEEAMAWLADNVPATSGASLVHNDYKFDNVMLDPLNLTRITAVLDWEMVTVGDPLMDLGTTLGYWMGPDAPGELLSMPFNPRVLMENISHRDLIEMYAEARGQEVPDMRFYYVYGTFKIAVIAQQIYARYAKGLTQDARFAAFDKFVGALGQIAVAATDGRSF